MKAPVYKGYRGFLTATSLPQTIMRSFLVLEELEARRCTSLIHLGTYCRGGPPWAPRVEFLSGVSGVLPGSSFAPNQSSVCREIEFREGRPRCAAPTVRAEAQNVSFGSCDYTSVFSILRTS